MPGATFAADGVAEISRTTGTSNYFLAGPHGSGIPFASAISPTGASIQNGDTVNCFITDGSGKVEFGLYTYAAGPPAFLIRTVIVSPAGTIDWPAGRRIIRLVPAAASHIGLLTGLITPPASIVSGAWTNLNISGTSSVADGDLGPMVMARDTDARRRGLHRAAPTPPYTISAAIRVPPVNLAVHAGLFFHNGTDKLVTIGRAGSQLTVEQWSDATTWVSDAASVDALVADVIRVQLGDDGTNVTYSISGDGQKHYPIYSVAKASGYLGASGYTRVGFFLGTGFDNGNPFPATLTSWLQQ